MKNTICTVAVILTGLFYFVGCSQDDRDEVIERTGNAWNALNGETTSGEKTARVVKEQQRKERIRQNNTWTPENRARNPVEFCQAALEAFKKKERELEAIVHETSCSIVTVKRIISENESMEENLKKFLEEAKLKYKECEAANSWPMVLRGYTLSREKVQCKIVETSRKLREIQSKYVSNKNKLTALEKRLKKQQADQEQLARDRDQIQSTLNDIRTKKIVDRDDGIANSMKELMDKVNALGSNCDDPKVEDLIQPDETTTQEEEFAKIMAE